MKDKENQIDFRSVRPHAVAGVRLAVRCSPHRRWPRRKNLTFAAQDLVQPAGPEGIWMPAKPVDNLEKGGYIKDPAEPQNSLRSRRGGKARRELEECKDG